MATGEQTLGVEFYWRAREDPRRGRRDVEYVKIRIPGSRDVLDHPVTEEDRARYAREYEAFRQGRSQIAAAGTPLVALEGVPRSQVEDLESRGIRTIEQLAGLLDSSAFMGSDDLRRRAQKHVEAARAAAPSDRLARALAERDDEIESLRRELAALRNVQK